MILLADSGSTKTTWSLVDKHKQISRFATQGINPFFQNSSEVRDILVNELIPQLEVSISAIDKICFFGAGCTAEKSPMVAKTLQSVFEDTPNVTVDSDMVGAALGTIGRERGIVAILGTGSNSALFEDGSLLEQVSPLGFILGDEGSGSVLGKKLLGDVLKKHAPEEILEAFREEYPDYTKELIIEKVYRLALPNRFLAQFTPFIKKHESNLYCQELVSQSFQEFLTRNIASYTDYRLLPIHAVGSIAFHFDTIWSKVLETNKCKKGTTIKEPIEGLELYFQNEF